MAADRAQPLRLFLDTGIILDGCFGRWGASRSAIPLQVVGTTHSPQLLRFLSPEKLDYAALVYRLPDQPDARIARIVDLPAARDVIERQDVGRLFESGWLEDAVAFGEDKDVEIPDDMEIPV